MPYFYFNFDLMNDLSLYKIILATIMFRCKAFVMEVVVNNKAFGCVLGNVFGMIDDVSVFSNFRLILINSFGLLLVSTF